MVVGNTEPYSKILGENRKHNGQRMGYVPVPEVYSSESYVFSNNHKKGTTQLTY
jgi:hypothetical protein